MAMSQSQARVVDPVLTNVARGYKPQDFIGLKLFPRVEVYQSGGTVIEFGKEQFYLQNTQRPPGGTVAVSESGYGNRKYALENHDLSEKVPIELLKDASAVPGINLGSRAVLLGMEKNNLRLEYTHAQIARDASKYAASNKMALSGTDQWSDAGSNPAADIREAKEAIRAKIGRYPNVLTLGAPVLAALQENPKIQDKFKYVSKESINAAMLAALFEIPEVAIGTAVTANPNTGAFTDVWGKDAILSFSAVEALATMGAPSFGLTYQMSGYPLAEKPWYNPADKSWYYPVSNQVSAEMVGPDAGFLIQAASG